MKYHVIALLNIFLISSIGFPLPETDPGQVRIEWEAVPGARGYIVEIQNPQRKTIIKKNTPANYLLQKIDPGTYRIKITVLNIFMKPDTSTGWANLTIKKTTPPKDDTLGMSEKDSAMLGKEKKISREEEPEKKTDELTAKKEEQKQKEKEADHEKHRDYSRGLLGLGQLDIAAGASCQIPLAPWSRYLKIAPSGHVNMSYGLSGIPKASSIPFISSLGFMVKFSVIPFKGKSRYGSPVSLLTMAPGAGMFYGIRIGAAKQWSFDFRLSVIVGSSFSILTKEGQPRRDYRAIKLYYDSQALFKFSYGGYFFIDTGFGYLSVLYNKQPLYSLYPFIQAGIRL